MPADTLREVLLAPGLKEGILRVGVSGHQDRAGIDWTWVRHEIECELDRVTSQVWGISSLAQGADQIFAQAVLARGGHLIAVVPIIGYERYFDGEALVEYRSLLKQSKVVRLDFDGDPEEAFLRAGRYVADHSDLLIAVWDGAPAKGPGGTADIVQHVQDARKPWIHVNPTLKVVVRYA